VHALVGDAIDLSMRFAGDTGIERLCGLLNVVIRRRHGNAAAFGSKGSYPTVAVQAALNETWR
jgi:hypothetical protein